jgi:hypothetical protein
MYIFAVFKETLQTFEHLVILHTGNMHHRIKIPSCADIINQVNDSQLVKAIQFNIGSLY